MTNNLQPNSRLDMALTAYSLPHSIGLLPTQNGEAHSSPLNLISLMDAACALGLSAVEVPLLDADFDAAKVRDELQKRDLKIVTDFMALLDADAETFKQFLRNSAAVGAHVTRACASLVLCGKRRGVAGGWGAHLEAVANRLNEVLPLAEDLGLCIALENHQDTTSDDLLRLHEMTHHHAAYGVTLDTGNPLAVGEGILEFTTRVAPLVRHLHLKDYTIHFAPEGFRLVRCVAGAGVVPFDRVLDIIGNNGHDVLPGIEIAALPTRTIPILDDDWWRGFPPADARQLVPSLQTLWRHGRGTDEPYGSVWEHGGDSRAVSEEEWSVLEASVGYFKALKEEKRVSS